MNVYLRLPSIFSPRYLLLGRLQLWWAPKMLGKSDGKGEGNLTDIFAPARSNPKSVCGSNVPKSRNRAEPKFQSGLYFRAQTFVSSRMGNPNGNDLAWRTIRIDIRPICIAARREMERKNRQTVGPVSLTVSLMRHFECPAVVKMVGVTRSRDPAGICEVCRSHREA